MPEPRDYADSGLDIQSAMVDHVRTFPDKSERPDHILWDGVEVKTSDAVRVPETGVVRATFLSATADVEQGFDLKVDGWLELAGGERVPLLRTWKDERYEDTVSYPFLARDGLLRFWNVFKREWPNGTASEEKWTGNAGFWIEQPSDGVRIYHCSHGVSASPDFESLLVRLEIL